MPVIRNGVDSVQCTVNGRRGPDSPEWATSTTRVQRLGQLHGFVVRRTPRKKRGLHVDADQPRHLREEGPGHVWTYDFIFDTTENGRTLKIMTVMDEGTRQSLSIVVGCTMTSKEVVV